MLTIESHSTTVDVQVDVISGFGNNGNHQVVHYDGNGAYISWTD